MQMHISVHEANSTAGWGQRPAHAPTHCLVVRQALTLGYVTSMLSRHLSPTHAGKQLVQMCSRRGSSSGSSGPDQPAQQQQQQQQHGQVR
jgi:hypothetical protein